MFLTKYQLVIFCNAPFFVCVNAFYFLPRRNAGFEVAKQEKAELADLQAKGMDRRQWISRGYLNHYFLSLTVP